MTMKRAKTIAAVAILAVAIFGILIYFTDVKMNDEAQKKLKEFDLLELYAQNDDLVGWIHIEDTGIDYPVMNSDYYLSHNFFREESNAGTPFVAEGYSPENPNILIYGHNMIYDKTMFYDLIKYKDKDFYEEHQEVIYYAICTNQHNKKYVEKRTYHVMSVIITDTKEWQYWEYAYKDSDIKQYVKEAYDR